MKKFIILSFLINLLFADLAYDLSQSIFDDTQLPEIYIEIDADSLAWIYDNVQSDKYFHADMRYVNNEIDTLIPDIGFRLRGNTSREAQKKSFKVSFNEFNDNRRFYGLKKFNLNGEHNDPSIIRSKLCWHLFDQMNVEASRANHVKVYINSSYYGLYINTEHYDDIFLSSRFNNNVGNFYKCLWPADLTYISENPDDYKFFANDRRTYELKTNEKTDNYSDLAHLIKIINQSPNTSFADSLYQYFDVWNFLKVLSINVLTGSWDDYWFLKNNYYLYNDIQQGKFVFVPYDYDNSFGISWFSIDWGYENIYTWGNMNGESRPLVDRILEVPEFRSLYGYLIDFTIDNYFNADSLFSYIDRIKDMISSAAEEDSYRTYDYGFSNDDFHNSFDDALGGHVTYGLKDYITTRGNSAKNQSNYSNLKPYIISQLKINWLSENNIEISAMIFDESQPTDVTLFLANGNSYTMDFINISNDGGIPIYNYSANLEITNDLQYYIQIDDTDGNIGYLPFNAPNSYLRIPFQSKSTSLVINELMADNENTIQDPSGENDDWLEIYNAGTETVDLSGYYLTDNPQSLDKWAFPAMSIAPGEFLLIWADEDEKQAGLHTNFKLDKDGEYLAITKNVNGVPAIIDSVFFGTQSEDISYGRETDGGLNWQKMSPTPGYSNNSTKIDDENLLLEFSLSQNYPNPFNPVTMINYQLATTNNVRLDVFNMLGEKVSTLVSGNQHAGNYSVVWDASGLATGIYLYQLKVGHKSEMKKMLLVK